MLQLRIFNIANISFKIIRENKILKKIFEFTVNPSVQKGLKCLSFDGIIPCLSPKKPILYQKLQV